jgi:hypothetical protein
MAAPSSWRRSVAVLLMLLMCGSAGANFVVETSVLEIIQPVATNFSMAVANFGNPLYGGSLRCARAPWRAVPVARVRVAGAHSRTQTEEFHFCVLPSGLVSHAPAPPCGHTCSGEVQYKRQERFACSPLQARLCLCAHVQSWRCQLLPTTMELTCFVACCSLSRA